MPEQNDLLLDPDFDVKERPPSRWRNWFRKRYSGKLFRADGTLESPYERAGSLIPDYEVWPSKEIAEQKARDDLSVDPGPGFEWDEYVGAFPDGEHP